MHKLSKVEEMAVNAALEKMQSSYFSICTIDKILKALGYPDGGLDSRAYNTLNLVHCVNFSDMEPELRNSINPLMAKVFGIEEKVIKPRESTEVMVREEPKQSRGFLSLKFFN